MILTMLYECLMKTQCFTVCCLFLRVFLFSPERTMTVQKKLFKSSLMNRFYWGDLGSCHTIGFPSVGIKDVHQHIQLQCDFFQGS